MATTKASPEWITKRGEVEQRIVEHFKHKHEVETEDKTQKILALESEEKAWVEETLNNLRAKLQSDN